MKDYPENHESIDEVSKHIEQESVEVEEHPKKRGAKKMRIPSGLKTEMSVVAVYGIPPRSKR